MLGLHLLERPLKDVRHALLYDLTRPWSDFELCHFEFFPLVDVVIHIVLPFA